MNVAAIIGRPNVGKSTLFNRLLRRRKAIVDIVSGVTRDRHYGESYWNGVKFFIIDTGGYTLYSNNIIEEEMRKQIFIAIKEANSIIFMVDVTTGLIDIDIEIAKILRKEHKKIILAVNKIDSTKNIYDATYFYKLGFDKYFCISSINGSGTGDLLDELLKTFPKGKDTQKNESLPSLPKLAIVGRPNVGKSTLINTLLMENRNIVTNIPGTTRDPININYNLFGFKCILIDTAGIRKKSKLFNSNIEFYAVIRTIKSIEDADVCLLMIDATRGWESTDTNIFNIIKNNNKGILIIINKWDLVEKKTDTNNLFKNIIKNKISNFKDVPIFFISSINKKGILPMMEAAMQLAENRKLKIKTSVLNKTLLPILQNTPPPSVKGKFIKIKYCTQLPTYTPQFVFFTNFPNYIKYSYKKFIENKMRIFFKLKGIPIGIHFRKK
ncbi:MAG: ribosome biogenesis GTPase Der [Candidatus Bostrichicola ureolyticus]|nr:MAG: ribosome biogenesis GTPase Der [Candidatus Bostrichicola ureolyticus]